MQTLVPSVQAMCGILHHSQCTPIGKMDSQVHALFIAGSVRHQVLAKIKQMAMYMGAVFGTECSPRTHVGSSDAVRAEWKKMVRFDLVVEGGGPPCRGRW